MSRIAALQSRLNDVGLNSLKGPLRRVVRWYLAPSGLLLLLASGLLTLAFLDWGPSWASGGAGVVLLTVFLAYRFSRQQGLLLRALQNHQQTATEQLGGLRSLQTELAHSLKTQSELLATHIKSVEQQFDGLEVEDQHLLQLQRGLASTQAIAAGLDYRMRVIGDGQHDLSGRVSAAEVQIDAARKDQAGALDDLDSARKGQAEALNDQAEALNELQRSMATIESFVDDATDQDDEPVKKPEPVKPGPVESDSLIAEAVGAMRSDVAMWAASTANQSFNGVAIVVSPERSGTTWAFDVLRSLPGASQIASSFVYRTLGIAGNRYPKDLIDRDPHGEPIELRDGVGAFLPRLRQQTFGHTNPDLLAVEKVHPSAFDFEPTALLSSLGRLEQSLGRVQLVLLIRDPVDAYRSFVSYQESAGWHKDVSTDSVAQFFASSLSAMLRLCRLHDGCLIASYEDLIADPLTGYTNIADRLGLKTDTSAVTHVLDAAEQWRARAAKSPYFSARGGQAKPAQLVIGRGLASETEREALAAARLVYEELWTERVT